MGMLIDRAVSHIDEARALVDELKAPKTTNADEVKSAEAFDRLERASSFLEKARAELRAAERD